MRRLVPEFADGSPETSPLPASIDDRRDRQLSGGLAARRLETFPADVRPG